ncbi:Mannose-6-phosphate isomerase [Diplodia seriata]|uniref:Mannose-6-phosphate isomerase n=1 Tax=Diplodia seriata TaxID=420778 RepID=A0ABR3C1T5_9PEZI
MQPEMTIAITPFDGFCGFRPLAEIAHFLANVPTFRKLVGEEAAANFENTIKGRETSTSEEDTKENKAALQQAFTSLMTSDASDIEATAQELLSTAQSEGASFAGGGVSSSSGEELAELVQRLSNQFPGDIGLFVLFFLNYVKLDVGEAMFLKADDIHAYLSGDIIECMASSDNVVRAGFTPKFKDVGTLTSMLTYSYAPIEDQKMTPKDFAYVTHNTKSYSSASDSELYDPPIDEFSVVRTALRAPGAKVTFDPIMGPSIVLCTSGRGTIAVGPKKEPIEPGFVYFVGATAECVLESETDKGEEFVTFKAFCELDDDKTKSSL